MIIKIQIQHGIPFKGEEDKSIKIETEEIIRFSGCLEDAMIEMSDGTRYKSTDRETNRLILNTQHNQR